MQIAPISRAGFRGPAKPAEYERPVEWTRQELAAGIYGEFCLIEDSRETICPIFPVAVRIGEATDFLRITVFRGGVST